MRVGSTSTPRNTPPFMVAASGWAPPMPPRPPETTSRPARLPPKCWRGQRGEGLVGALQDPLGADVDPGPGGHLAVHGQPQRLQPAELVPGGPARDQVGVGDQHPGGVLVGAEHAHRLAALDQQRLVVAQPLQRGDDGGIALPVARRLARPAVDHQILGALGHLGVEVVLQHPQRRLLVPAPAGQPAAARRPDGAAGSGARGHGRIIVHERTESPRALRSNVATGGSSRR